MNIGIYGHSIALWDGKEELSFIKKIKDHFDANIVNTGRGMCSQERILFDLKKTKKIDLAIVVHSNPEYIFVPAWHRDVHSVDRYTILKKANNNAGYRETLNIFFKDNSSKASDPEAVQAWYEEEFGNLKGTMDTDFYQGMVEALVLNKQYLFHPDMQRNRYYGALMQVDQYLTSKQIPTVHCLGKSHWYPNWFKFTSGEIEPGAIQGLRKNSKYVVGYNKSCNAINAEGNNLIFNTLLPLINAARSKVVIR